VPIDPQLLQQLREVQVEVSRDSRVLHVTLSNAAGRNTQSPAMWMALAQLGKSIPAGVDVVVLRAQGPVFSAGLDLDLLEPSSPVPVFRDLIRQPVDAITSVIAGYQEAFTWWHEVDALSIAVVQGAAVGAGCQLALGCDLRVASAAAFFSLPEVSLGLVPDLGGISRLGRMIGVERTLDMVATSRRVSAREAAAWGFVSRLERGDSLDEAVSLLTTSLLSLPGEVLREVRELARSADFLPEPQHLAAQARAQARLMSRYR